MFINRIFHVKMLLKDGAEYIQKESAQKSNNTQQLHIECGCYILTQWTKQQATDEKKREDERKRCEKQNQFKAKQKKNNDDRKSKWKTSVVVVARRSTSTKYVNRNYVV